MIEAFCYCGDILIEIAASPETVTDSRRTVGGWEQGRGLDARALLCVIDKDPKTVTRALTE